MTKADRRLAWIALLLCAGAAILCAQETREVTLRLKNGDRLTGRILFEDDQRVVLTTPWNAAIFVPRLEIQQQVVVLPPSSSRLDEVAGMGASTNHQVLPEKPVEYQSGSPSGTGQQPAQLAQVPLAPAKAPAPEKPSHWNWNLKLGADFISGAKDREIYFGQTALTYTRNYQRNPKEFLRNTLEYQMDYGRADGQVSVNRMLGANKLDFDVGKHWYGYASAGGGYDQVRKISNQYEVGSGLGYHLIADKNVALDTEFGFNYQYREELNSAPDRELPQLRVGQELTWQILPKITLSEQVAFLPLLEDPSQYQVRLEGNLGFGIVKYLSLNLTVLNFYDTQPAPGVPNNEFQFRSSFGVNF